MPKMVAMKLIPAVSVVTLKVEPGGYSPWVARSRIGSPSAVPNSRLNSFSDSPFVHTSGL